MDMAAMDMEKEKELLNKRKLIERRGVGYQEGG
jgi:hypothetical protein